MGAAYIWVKLKGRCFVTPCVLFLTWTLWNGVCFYSDVSLCKNLSRWNSFADCFWSGLTLSVDWWKLGYGIGLSLPEVKIFFSNLYLPWIALAILDFTKSGYGLNKNQFINWWVGIKNKINQSNQWQLFWRTVKSLFNWITFSIDTVAWVLLTCQKKNESIFQLISVWLHCC